jgi:hypothetical protein
MSRSRAAAPLKRDSSYSTLSSSGAATTTKKIHPAPLDPKLAKQVKLPLASGGGKVEHEKSPHKKVKSSQNI